jgi:ABC-type polysaccharide/polyol phosphate export permease
VTRSADVAEDDQFLGEYHVYDARRSGLPQLRPYFRELWRRRGFAMELARTEMQAAHTTTFFGQLWLVLNPLLLGSVYYVLVDILGGGGKRSDPMQFFSHLLAGLFVFYFISGAMITGAGSVVKGGRLILNTSFPRMLLPLSTTFTAFRRFLPTMIVYGVAHVVAGNPVSLRLLWAPVIFALVFMFALGLALLFATLQVYFRDTGNFLPYLNRMWLYLSPVLYFAEKVPEKIRILEAFNPLYPLLGIWSDVLIKGDSPSWTFLLAGAGWAIGTLGVGGLVFLYRERDFAVRI